MAIRPVRPTHAELAILRVLWERGPGSVRDVQKVLNDVKPTGYTTVLKLLQIMAEKGLVARDESARAHVYRAQVEETATQRLMVRELLDRAFGGSAGQLVMQALSTRRATPDEIVGIRRLLDEMETTGGKR
jgi:predicted transcriptional regulator